MIGRENEKKMLLATLEKKEAQFVAVYGRRRIGKTYLVRKTFGDKFTFHHTGVANVDMAEQLRKFGESLERYGVGDGTAPKSWMEAFRKLEDVITSSREKKKVVFIDELPWMDTHKSGFISAFEGFWNGWGSWRDDLVLIICGSATSWIVNKVLKNRGGLHNRVTNTIYLQPFSLYECREMAREQGLSLSDLDYAELYMVFGGVAYYWSLFEKGKSVAQIVDSLCFARGGRLRNEFNELYASLFNADGPHIGLIRAIATRKCGVTADELFNIADLPHGGTQMKCLDELDICGFIRKFTAFGKRKRDSLYQLIDNFTLFYLKFMESESNPDEHFWTHSTISQVVNTWRGLAFERICLQHIAQIKQAIGISGVLTKVYSWRHVPNKANPDGAQIDLVIERADRVVNLCEIKFSRKPYVITKDYDQKLNFKSATFQEVTKTRLAPQVTMITTYGVSRNGYLSAFQSEVTMQDLFSEVRR